MNFQEIRKEIIQKLLTTESDKVLLVVWCYHNNDPNSKYIDNIIEVNLTPSNNYYAVRIANGKKISKRYLSIIDELLQKAEEIHKSGDLITITTEEWQLKGGCTHVCKSTV